MAPNRTGGRLGGFRREVQPRRQHWFLNEKSGFPFQTPAFCSVSNGQRRLGEKEYRAPSVTPGVALRVGIQALIHPLLDAAEGMLNDLAATVENLRPLLQARGHAIEHGLVFEARNGAHVVRASRAHRAVTTGFSIPVIDFGEIAQPAVADWRQYLSGRADIGVAPRVVAKLVLAEEARADRGAALRSGNVRNAAGLLAGL